MKRLSNSTEQSKRVEICQARQRKFIVGALVCAAVLGGLRPARAAIVLQYDSQNYVAGTWTDTSPSANNATQGTVGFQPTLTGTTPSGKPALVFDGTDDQLNLTTALSAPAFTSSPNLTIVTVVKNTASAPNASTFIAGSVLDAADFDLSNDGPGQGHLRLIKPGVSNGGQSDFLSPTQWAVYAVTYDGSSYTFYTNGAAVATVATDLTTYANPLTTIGEVGVFGGSYNFLQGQMAALYVYDSALTAGDIQTLNSQLTVTYLDVIPEPSTVLLFTVGGLVLWRRAKK